MLQTQITIRKVQRLLVLLVELNKVNNREAIRLASKRLIGDKGDQIRALIQKIDIIT